MFTIDASVWIAAFQPQDLHHAPSVRWLEAILEKEATVHSPVIVILETACAIARLTRNATKGREAAKKLETFPNLRLEALSNALLQESMKQGTSKMLRSADALYAATAYRTQSKLISWDNEHIQRANALTPSDSLKQLARNLY